MIRPWTNTTGGNGPLRPSPSLMALMVMSLAWTRAIGFAAAPALAVACGSAVLGGIGNGIQWAPLVSAVQRLTPPSLHGRVMGAMESIGAISPAIGLTLGGVLVAVSSPRTAFLIVGAGAALTTIAFARIPIGSGPAAGAGPPGDEPGAPTVAAKEGAGEHTGQPALS